MSGRRSSIRTLVPILVVVSTLAGACRSDDDAGADSASQTAVTTAIETDTIETDTIESDATPDSTETAGITTIVVTPTAPTASSSPVAASVPVTSLAGSSPSTECGSVPVGVTEITLTGGGAEHPVRVFVPSAASGTRLPAVIDWHGLGSNGVEQAGYSDYESVAEEQGFIVVHPTGVIDETSGQRSWQVVGDWGTTDRDDLAFANTLIDDLVADWCADPARIYSTGMSNGGFFTARLVCEIPDRIAAAVSVAGTFHPETCSPSRVVPYVAIHGTDDRVVPYDGSGESVLLTDSTPDELRVFFSQVMPDEFAEFAVGAGCEAAPVDSDVGVETVRFEYVGCDGGTPMAFYEVIGGGHTWPGSPWAASVVASLGHTTDDIDATRDGWAFMSQHSLA